MDKNQKPLRERLLPEESSPGLGGTFQDDEADDILNQRFAINNGSYDGEEAKSGIGHQGSQSHP